MRKKVDKLVTKDKVKDWVERNPVHTIGRALVAIYNRQTAQEQSMGATVLNNGVGFSGCDAEVGSRCAKHYKLYFTLKPWMVLLWSKPDAKGYPRIARYHSQLNDIARAKAARMFVGVQDSMSRYLNKRVKHSNDYTTADKIAQHYNVPKRKLSELESVRFNTNKEQ